MREEEHVLRELGSGTRVCVFNKRSQRKEECLPDSSAMPEGTSMSIGALLGAAG